jgi:murein DD-endopeptidase
MVQACAVIAFVASLLALTTQGGQTRPPVVQSIDLAVPLVAVAFPQGDRQQLVYELHITNFQPVDVTLTSVRINVGTTLIAEYRDAELQRRMTRPGLGNSHATPHIVGPGMRAVVNIWMPVASGTPVPRAIGHTVELTIQRQSGPVHATVEGGTAAVSVTSAVTIAPPLRGGQWVAIYDPLLKGGHRTAIYTVDGRARIPGRFAIDFIALPPSGAMERDSAARRPTANGFGAEVLAVADGTVAAAVDDTPDHLPQPVAPEVASGNHVVLAIGDGRFAVYEHLQHGSVGVKAGQRVARGDVIARLGASGSTSIGPHLHFHIADANSVLGAEGVPFVFDRFTVLGEFASIAALVNGEKWQPAQQAQASRAARPAPNSVIAFR